jgi:hypothetical protein
MNRHNLKLITALMVTGGLWGGAGTNALASVDFSGTSAGGRVASAFSDVSFQYGTQLSGNPNLTPVPEPATLIAGALLLVPFGASTLRIWRSKRSA